MKHLFLLLIVALASLAMVLPAPAPPLPLALEGGTPQATTQAGCWHRVAEGETLRSISARYFGSGRHWRTLQIANDVPAAPTPGTALWIPGHGWPTVDNTLLGSEVQHQP